MWESVGYMVFGAVLSAVWDTVGYKSYPHYPHPTKTPL
jgi:hypothetical protein